LPGTEAERANGPLGAFQLRTAGNKPKRWKRHLDRLRWSNKLDDLNEHRWDKAQDELQTATGENRMRVQVCPRGCSRQLARRDIVTRTRLSGKADIRIKYSFETLSCGKCGTPYLRQCGRCASPIFAPVVDRCESCGLPHPWAVERRAAATRSQPRQWKGKETHSPAVLLAAFGHGKSLDKELFVVDGDITTFAVDALISNDDTDGRMWALVASSIKSAAGADIELESVSHGPYPLGSAWFTHGGNLPTNGVIHVGAMGRNGQSNGFETIGQCVRSALKVAVDKGMESVALATIGTTPPTTPQVITLDDWLKKTTPDIVNILDATCGRLAVLLVLYEQDNFNELVELLRLEVASAVRMLQPSPEQVSGSGHSSDGPSAAETRPLSLPSGGPVSAARWRGESKLTC
jgi:O-acetyl-ADP-ribose deacetylase (regulator of RNase III)/RNase P subunit RPR2